MFGGKDDAGLSRKWIQDIQNKLLPELYFLYQKNI